MKQQYKVITLDNGREWITDLADFGMYADALPELITAASKAVKVLWNREDKTEEEFRETTLALSQALSHVEDHTDPDDDEYYSWPLPRMPLHPKTVTVQVYVQDADANRNAKPRRYGYECKYGLHRTPIAFYHTTLVDGQAIVEEAFAGTNEPERKGCFAEYHGPSMSVGDAVIIDRRDGRSEVYLCDSYGWVKVEGERAWSIGSAIYENNMEVLDREDLKLRPTP
jgi:hypothetical protein